MSQRDNYENCTLSMLCLFRRQQGKLFANERNYETERKQAI